MICLLHVGISRIPMQDGEQGTLWFQIKSNSLCSWLHICHEGENPRSRSISRSYHESVFKDKQSSIQE